MARIPESGRYTRSYIVSLLLLVVGFVLFASFISAEVLFTLQGERSMRSFDGAQRSYAVMPDGIDGAKHSDTVMPDGIDGAKDSDTVMPDDIEGVLRIPALDIRVPVYTGTDELTLNRGAGRIEWTPPLGSAGNVGVAAHRDRAFRALKDIEEGDEIHVDRLDGTLLYEVVGVRIVDPEDVHVLSQTETPYLTLVTCYPFDFVGSAPRRFIVHARLSAGRGHAGSGDPPAADESRRVGL